mmetsp:Transcript_17715/g.37936  ORF Transcript_17715/g.37936 Transcript_17715/m.37936 type:complete len:335 (-) Transcript_17715:184-1188(-)
MASAACHSRWGCGAGSSASVCWALDGSVWRLPTPSALRVHPIRPAAEHAALAVFVPVVLHERLIFEAAGGRGTSDLCIDRFAPAEAALDVFAVRKAAKSPHPTALVPVKPRRCRWDAKRATGQFQVGLLCFCCRDRSWCDCGGRCLWCCLLGCRCDGFRLGSCFRGLGCWCLCSRSRSWDLGRWCICCRGWGRGLCCCGGRWSLRGGSLRWGLCCCSGDLWGSGCGCRCGSCRRGPCRGHRIGVGWVGDVLRPRRVGSGGPDAIGVPQLEAVGLAVAVGVRIAQFCGPFMTSCCEGHTEGVVLTSAHVVGVPHAVPIESILGDFHAVRDATHVG